MTPTLFGVLTIALCSLLLLHGRTLLLMRAVLMLSLMGGSAALVLTGLGGSTVQPAIVGLALLLLRCLLPGPGQRGSLALSARDLTFLLVFVLYGAVGAMILPRIFAGAIDVTPLRPIPNGYIYAAFPLTFSPQNVTSAIYLLCTLAAAFCGHLVCQRHRDPFPIARTAAAICVIHALLGLSSVVLAGTAWTNVLAFFRNGFYAQLDQTVDGLARMTGIFPEAAVYAAYGFTWFVFTTELWLRGIAPRRTGTGAALLGAALVLSTSTTAYVGLAAYALIMLGRMTFIPGAIAPARILGLAAGALSLAAGALALLVLNPDAAMQLQQTLARFTLDKADSASALQRAFWAGQGLSAFTVSGGLGIGPGSFRSSSIVLAILGSTGVIGCVAILAHLWRVFKPARRSTWLPTGDPAHDAAVAAAWTVVIALIPASVSAATPDPGVIWGFLCGCALSLRPAPDRARAGSGAAPEAIGRPADAVL